MFNLSDYKEAISGGLVVLFAILAVTNVISYDTFIKLFGIFMGAGVAALGVRAKRLESKLDALA